VRDFGNEKGGRRGAVYANILERPAQGRRSFERKQGEGLAGDLEANALGKRLGIVDTREECVSSLAAVCLGRGLESR
jgi:stage III sporulation protein SpoIIIAA